MTQETEQVAERGVMALSELIAAMDAQRVPTGTPSGWRDPEITGLSLDSRRVRPGHVFFALQGSKSDGGRFVADAVARGAVAVVSAGAPSEPAPAVDWLRVDAPRSALAAASKTFFGAPDAALDVVGITGTNGKTTTSLLLAAACDAAGHPAGVVGTLGSGAAGSLSMHAGNLTTPEAPDLWQRLAEMHAAGRKVAVLEVSSHALMQERVAGVRFACAVFTNLSRDHLDYHEDMEQYFAAKARLFLGLPPDAAMAVNLDDPFGTRLTTPSRHRVVTYGRATRAALFPLETNFLPGETLMRIATPQGEIAVRTFLQGRPNQENVLAALAAACALDLDLKQAAEGIAQVRSVPGRLEPVDAGQDFRVLVDFAHTDAALENALTVVREMAPDGRVLVVFGCGGDRDPGKRARMGAAASRLADIAYLTSDNPRTEDPAAIVAAIVEGFDAAGGPAARHVEIDRAGAIALALAEARAGDTVLIAGKGHETEQIFADRRIPFDDAEVARAALSSRPGKGS